MSEITAEKSVVVPLQLFSSKLSAIVVVCSESAAGLLQYVLRKVIICHFCVKSLLQSK